MARAAYRQQAPHRHAGFSYLGLLFAVVIIGITLATVGVVWSTHIRREKEADLLFAGDQIRAAIGRYYGETPIGAHVYPGTLADLLQDERGPKVRRHLRRLYFDPMTASADWQLIDAPEGGIMGVVSGSLGTPIKQTNFSSNDADFEQADCYCKWRFIYTPPYQRRAQSTIQH